MQCSSSQQLTNSNCVLPHTRPPFMRILALIGTAHELHDSQDWTRVRRLPFFRMSHVAAHCPCGKYLPLGKWDGCHSCKAIRQPLLHAPRDISANSGNIYEYVCMCVFVCNGAPITCIGRCVVTGWSVYSVLSASTRAYLVDGAARIKALAYIKPDIETIIN